MTLRTLVLAASASATTVVACGAPSRPEPTPPVSAPTQPTPPPAEQPVAPPMAPPPSLPQKIRTVEGITEYRLDNGLTVLLFPDPSQSTITVDVTYLVGSRHEGYGETGMAHLLEHMMFKGSPRHRNVLKLNEQRGGQANGNTYLDRTTYFETLPATPDNLDWALDLESDRMVNAEVSADDLKTEFSVVRNEFESDEDQPVRILDERVTETAYIWHNYGHPTIGSRADIERVPAPVLRKFYEKYYQPDNAVLVVAGKFDDGPALATIVKTFGAIPKPTRVLPATYSVEPVQDGERRIALARTGDVTLIEIAYHGVSGPSPDYAATEAAADIMTREPSGRLYSKLVKTGLAASVSSNVQAFHDPGLITFSAQVRDAKNADKVEKIMIDDLDALGAGKVDDKEVERWRVSDLKEIELAMTNSQALVQVLVEFIAQGDWRALFAYRNHVAVVTAADVQRVAAAYFTPSNRTIGRFVPTKEPKRAPLTEAASVADLVKDIKEGTAVAEGEQFAGTLDNIDARTKRGEIKGGIKTALLAKKTRGGKVQLDLRLHWGDDKSLQGKVTAGSLLGSLMVRGTKTKSYQDIADLEDKLKLHLSVDTSATGLTLKIDTLRDQLAPALDLAIDILTNPTLPADQLDIVKQETLAGIEAQLKDPQAIAVNAFERIVAPWPKGDPRYPETTEEQLADVKAASVADIRAFYRDFAGAGHGELVVVGDFDPAAVTAQVEKLTSTWLSKKPYTRVASKVFNVPGEQKSIDVKDKENTVVILGEDQSLRDSDADYPVWLVMNEVLGGGASARLWMRIREHEGLTYGVSTWAYAGTLDDAGGFGGYMIVAPQNLAKAKASMIDEITKMAGGGVQADELQRAKDAWIKEQDTELAEDGFVADMLSQQLYKSHTMDFTRKLRAAVAAVSAADVDRVAKARLAPGRLVIVDAGDKAKGAANAAKEAGH